MGLRAKFAFAFAVLAAAVSAVAAETAVLRPAQPATGATTVVYHAVLRNGFSIRHHHHEVFRGASRLYLSQAPDSGYVDVPTAEIVSFEKEDVPVPPPASAAGRDLEALVITASDQHRIDADLIHSVIQAESGFNPHAVSPKGAQGLMQLMPATASRLGVPNAFEPGGNIDGGTRYLRQLLELYHNDLVKALAAYNAGPQRVEQYHGVPPYRETRAYVARVIRDFNRKKLAHQSYRTTAPQKSPAVTGSAAKALAPAAPSASP